MATVLVIAPHAMDEVLGCGGTMALHADAGDRVETLVLFGDGTGMDAGRRVAGPMAANILRSQPPRFTGFSENRSDAIPLLDIIGAIERVITEIKPSTVYVTHGSNLNIDHGTVFRAAITAMRPIPKHPVRSIYTYEVLSSTDWSPPSFGQPFTPNRFVEITAVMDRKLCALECYSAEMRASPHSRSISGVSALGQSRGHSAGVTVAEAFFLVREILASS